MGSWSAAILYVVRIIPFQRYLISYSGHDMRADIQKKCSPYFNIHANISKKDKLRDVTPELEDFFKQIFIIDSKRRITFSNIVKHPLFAKHRKDFEGN